MTRVSNIFFTPSEIHAKDSAQNAKHQTKNGLYEGPGRETVRITDGQRQQQQQDKEEGAQQSAMDETLLPRRSGTGESPDENAGGNGNQRINPALVRRQQTGAHQLGK